MLNYNNQYVTHPLYTHFKSWIDMEDNYQDSYFIINTALYSAEQYIENTYDIMITPKHITENFGDVKKERGKLLYTKYNISNLLEIYTDDGFQLPTITYFDTTNNKLVKSNGIFEIEKRSNAFYNVQEDDVNIVYTSGYVYPPNISNIALVPSDDYDEGTVSTPSLYNEDGSPIGQVISTSAETLTLSIIGDPATSVYVNGSLAQLLDADGNVVDTDITPNIIINEDRIGKFTLSLVNGVNSFSIETQDSFGNTSQPISIIVNKQAYFDEPDAVIIGKDMVTVDGSYSITVYSTTGSVISINGVEVTSSSTGVDTFSSTLVSEGINNIIITVTSPSGMERHLTTIIDFDSTLQVNEARQLNNLSNNIIVMPQDLLMAILMLAHHYFKIALYKHEDTHSYGDNVSNRVTFIADRFPKDIHKILSKYVIY